MTDVKEKAPRIAKVNVELANGIVGWTTQKGVATKVNATSMDKGLSSLLDAHLAAGKGCRMLNLSIAGQEAEVLQTLYDNRISFTLYFDEISKSKKAQRAEAGVVYATSEKGQEDIDTYIATLAKIDAPKDE